MAYNYEDKLIETIKYIADSAVAAAPYDKTVRATILSCEDESIAKYKVRYQDAIFFAYGSTADVSFSPGAEVYVLIPNNDSTRDKTILGSTEKLGTNYVSIMNNDILYIPVGSNAVEGIENYNLSSFRIEEKVIYDINNTIENELVINNDSLKKSLADTAYIRFGANFSTEIPQKQQGGAGDYGIKFTLKFLKNDGSLDRGEQDINCVSRDYILNINDIENNPYNLNNHFQKKYFEIDGKNFVEVEKISIFSKDFTYQDLTEPDDIFINNFEITAVRRMDEASTGGAWMVVTAPMGPYFDNTHQGESKKKLETTIYVGGKIVNSESQKVNYYWFVEDVRVNSNWSDQDFYKHNYCIYGGQGWRCLNDFNIIKNENDNKEIIEWVGGKSYLEVSKEDIVSQEIRYKCVAIYNNLTLKDEVVFHNYDSAYNVKVESSAGELFYFDSGTTTLTCTVENYAGNDVTYVWGMTDYLGIEYYFQDFTTQGGRILGNKIEELPVYEIIKYSTYKCSAYIGDNLLGIGSITLTNSMEQGGQYNLVIENGSQVFKYNENGIAPNENPDGTPFVPSALGFVLYDSLGKEIDHEFLNNDYKWILPIDNTLLKFEGFTPEDIHTEEDEEGNIIKRWYEWTGENLSYKIAKQYNYNYTNNIIRLEVNYQGATFIADTNFTFTKEGEDGTNGTDYFCRIVPNTTTLGYPLVAVRKNNSDLPIFYCNGEILNNYVLDNFLKVEFFQNGEVINPASYSIKWEILKNNYYKSSSGIQYSDKSYIWYNESASRWERLDNLNPQGTTGSKRYVLTSPSPSLVVKATITFNELKYYATYPLNWITTYSLGMNYIYNIKGGFRYVNYAADGTRPQYVTEPFEIIIKNAQGQSVDGLIYNWNVYGYLYVKREGLNSWQWVKQESFKTYEVKDDNGTIIPNKIKVMPPEQYNGYCTNYIVECIVKDGSVELANIQIPVHMMLNRYGHAALNDWDGNSISIGKDGSGAILAPQIGAGRKEMDSQSEYYNAFTGVLMRRSKRSKS